MIAPRSISKAEGPAQASACPAPLDDRWLASGRRLQADESRPKAHFGVSSKRSVRVWPT